MALTTDFHQMRKLEDSHKMMQNLSLLRLCYSQTLYICMWESLGVLYKLVVMKQCDFLEEKHVNKAHY